MEPQAVEFHGVERQRAGRLEALDKPRVDRRRLEQHVAERGELALRFGCHRRVSRRVAEAQDELLLVRPGEILYTFDDEKLKPLPDHFLADELRRRIAAKPAEFLMRLQLAEPGDNLVNPTLQWPEGRKSVTVGRLVIDKVEAGAGGACDPITFNPLVLPKGIEPSDDPVLLARAAAYAVSLSRRLSGK